MTLSRSPGRGMAEKILCDKHGRLGGRLCPLSAARKSEGIRRKSLCGTNCFFVPTFFFFGVGTNTCDVAFATLHRSRSFPCA